MTVFHFILAAVALGVLVFVHELGHYFVARCVGMSVEVFSIGFGRPLLRWKWFGVNWQVGWLPFGGFVKIKGMDFGKEERERYREPHEIPGGFFAQAPWRRIAVVLAGPFANFLLAFVLFLLLFLMGGREKPFSEFTQIVGWVEPDSEVYAKGVRPGDLLTRYDGKPYKSSKDLLYATMLGGKEVELEGFHVDYATGERKPFIYTIESYPAPGALDDILTTGITSNARYMIYGSALQMPEGSPMLGSGVEPGDQLVWANGELLFSMDQMNALLNSNQVLLVVEREGRQILSRQPRVLTDELHLPVHVKNELEDWKYEGAIEARWHDLYLLPYVINHGGYVEGRLAFLDGDAEREAFPVHPYDELLEAPLEVGDRLLSVNGIEVASGRDVLKQVQLRRVQLIVKRGVDVHTRVPWLKEDGLFIEGVDWGDLEETTRLIGRGGVEGANSFVLLSPVEPKSIDQFVLTEEQRVGIAEEFERQRRQVEGIKDREKRNAAMRFLEDAQTRLMLGIPLQDRLVEYNPGPFTLFGSVFIETGQTLKALVMGYLHPKWLSGPIGIVRVIHHGWRIGLGEALFWIGAISLNLGFLNLLPIPVLDGGYVCLSLWEWVTKRRIKAKTMERLIIPFVVLLIGFLVFLTFQDISRLF